MISPPKRDLQNERWVQQDPFLLVWLKSMMGQRVYAWLMTGETRLPVQVFIKSKESWSLQPDHDPHLHTSDTRARFMSLCSSKWRRLRFCFICCSWCPMGKILPVHPCSPTSTWTVSSSDPMKPLDRQWAGVKNIHHSALFRLVLNIESRKVHRLYPYYSMVEIVRVPTEQLIY